MSLGGEGTEDITKIVVGMLLFRDQIRMLGVSRAMLDLVKEDEVFKKKKQLVDYLLSKKMKKTMDTISRMSAVQTIIAERWWDMKGILQSVDSECAKLVEKHELEVLRFNLELESSLAGPSPRRVPHRPKKRHHLGEDNRLIKSSSYSFFVWCVGCGARGKR